MAVHQPGLYMSAPGAVHISDLAQAITEGTRTYRGPSVVSWDVLPDPLLGRIAKFACQGEGFLSRRTLANLCCTCATIWRSPAVNQLWPSQLGYKHRPRIGNERIEYTERQRSERMANFAAGLFAKHRPCPKSLSFQGRGSLQYAFRSMLSQHGPRLRGRCEGVRHLEVMWDGDLEWGLLGLVLSLLPNVTRLTLHESCVEQVTLVLVGQVGISSLELCQAQQLDVERVTFADVARLTLLTSLEVDSLCGGSNRADLSPLTSLTGLAELTLCGLKLCDQGLEQVSQHCSRLTRLRMLGDCSLEGQICGWPYLKDMHLQQPENPYTAALGMHRAPKLQTLGMPVLSQDGPMILTLELKPETAEADIASLWRVPSLAAHKLRSFAVRLHHAVPLTMLRSLATVLPNLDSLELKVPSDMILTQADGASLAAAFPGCVTVECVFSYASTVGERDILRGACMCLGYIIAHAGFPRLKTVRLQADEWQSASICAEDVLLLLSLAASYRLDIMVDIRCGLPAAERQRLLAMRQLLTMGKFQ